MALLGTLRVNATADTRPMVKGFDKGRRSAKKLQTGLVGLKGVVGLLGTAFAISSVKRFADNQLEAIDVLAKTSRRLDLTTQSLGAYQFAAGLSGISTANLTTALEKMRDTIGAAALGEGTAVKTLDQLGLDPATLSASKTPLEDIQRSLAKIGDSNQKLAIVRDIFGRSGAQVLNLYENNLSEVRVQYEKLGLAVTGQEAKRIEEFNDKLSILSQRFASVGRNLLIDISPIALKALDRIEATLGVLQTNNDLLTNPLQGQRSMTMHGPVDRLELANQRGAPLRPAFYQELEREDAANDRANALVKSIADSNAEIAAAIANPGDSL